MRRISFIISFLLMLNSSINMAQSSTNSPFSQYGLGEFTQFYTPYNIAQGGVFSSIRSSANINIANPASYTATPRQSFLLEFGFQNKNSFYSEGEKNANTSDGNFTYFAAQLPITKWWSASFGLMPYSIVGYDISHIDPISASDSVQIDYTGKGGLNTVFIGNSIEIFNRISIGFNANFLYGNNQYISNATIYDDNFQSSLISKNSVFFHEFNYRMGIQYYDTLYSDISIVLGATFENKTNLKAFSDQQTINYLLINGEPYNDTLQYSENTEQLIEIPQYISGGLTIKKSNKLSLSVDYFLRDWKNALFLDKQVSSYNTEYGYSIGSEIIPSLGAPQIWRNIRYRFGVYYKQSNVIIDNNALLDYGIGFGVGVPIKVSSTLVNFTFNLGKRTTNIPNALEEYYANIQVNMSLGDIWFIKRKFN